jgi:hypothetical protein
MEGRITTPPTNPGVPQGIIQSIFGRQSEVKQSEPGILDVSKPMPATRPTTKARKAIHLMLVSRIVCCDVTLRTLPLANVRDRLSNVR